MAVLLFNYKILIGNYLYIQKQNKKLTYIINEYYFVRQWEALEKFF